MSAKTISVLFFCFVFIIIYYFVLLCFCYFPSVWHCSVLFAIAGYFLLAKLIEWDRTRFIRKRILWSPAGLGAGKGMRQQWSCGSLVKNAFQNSGALTFINFGCFFWRGAGENKAMNECSRCPKTASKSCLTSSKNRKSMSICTDIWVQMIVPSIWYVANIQVCKKIWRN